MNTEKAAARVRLRPARAGSGLAHGSLTLLLGSAIAVGIP